MRVRVRLMDRIKERVRVRVIPQRHFAYYIPHAEFSHITHTRVSLRAARGIPWMIRACALANSQKH